MIHTTQVEYPSYRICHSVGYRAGDSTVHDSREGFITDRYVEIRITFSRMLHLDIFNVNSSVHEDFAHMKLETNVGSIKKLLRFST